MLTLVVVSGLHGVWYTLLYYASGKCKVYKFRAETECGLNPEKILSLHRGPRACASGVPGDQSTTSNVSVLCLSFRLLSVICSLLISNNS